MSALRTDVLAGHYEVVALRLAVGLAQALRETAPATREELLASLERRKGPR